eukprot:gene25567-11218_t
MVDDLEAAFNLQLQPGYDPRLGAMLHLCVRRQIEKCLPHVCRAELEKAGKGDLPASMVDDLEVAFNLQIEPGYNPRLGAMLHLPLLFYGLTEALALFSSCVMQLCGYRRNYHQGLVFFTRNLSPPQAALARGRSQQGASSVASLDALSQQHSSSNLTQGGQKSGVYSSTAAGWMGRTSSYPMMYSSGAGSTKQAGAEALEQLKLGMDGCPAQHHPLSEVS